MVRSKKEWENRFHCVKKLMSAMDDLSYEFENNTEILETCATMLRNPVIFDNNVKDVKTQIPYSIENMGKETEDHLIGISNIVLYIFKKKLHKKWDSVEDFKNTLKALNVLLPIEKSLNNIKTFKHNWKFDYDNIESCLFWEKKLEAVGIEYLICNDTSKKVSVKVIRDEWYEKNKKFL
jgi:hypothetical protein